MIYYTPRLVIYALWLSSVVLSARQLTTNSNHTATYPTRLETHEVIVELAIFCDYDFANQFQNDDQELLRYWSAVLQDVHLRFTSLHNTTMAFRLNSLIILESREEQQFLETIRELNGTLSSHRALIKFARWVYIQSMHNNFTSFDIAVLAVGSPFLNRSVGISSIGGICRWVHENYTMNSVLAVTSFNPDVGRTLTHEIGHVLGALDDVEGMYPTSDCGNFSKATGSYIMGYSDDHKLLAHTFSPCSQKFIGKILQSNQSRCLRQVDTDIMPLIDTALNCPRTEAAANSVLETHCRLFVNDKAAYLSRELDNCGYAKCHYTFPFGTSTKHTMDMDLLNGMACTKDDNEGFCFRGTCLPSGNILMDVASKQCIGNGNYFGVNDKPLLIECQGLNASNPLNALRLETVKSGGVLVTIAYQSAADRGLRTKCLKVDGGGSNLVSFVDCASNSTKIIWKAEKNGEHPNELLLRHQFTDRCLVILQNASELNTTSNCSWENANTRWQNFTDQGIGMGLQCNLSFKRANYVIQDPTGYINYYVVLAVLIFCIVVGIILCVWGKGIHGNLKYI